MTQEPGGKTPPVIRAILAVWAFSAAVICLVITIYAAGHHGALALTTVTH